MLGIITTAILLTMGLALIASLRGPTVFDRILAVSMISTKTTLLIATLGFLFGRPDFLDIALLYALINFVGAIAVLKFFKYGKLGMAVEDGKASGAVKRPRTPRKTRSPKVGK